MTGEPQTMSRRERLRAQTLQEIEDASFAIIDADGAHALSIAALARSMAWSAPALYRYFPSRDALLAHLITHSYRQLTAAMGQALEGSRRTPRARVRLLVAAYRDWALRHRHRYGMLFGQRTDGLPEDAGSPTPLDQAMAMLVDLLVTLPENLPGSVPDNLLGSVPDNLLGSVPDNPPGDSTSGDRVLDGQLREWARLQQRPDTTPRAARAAIVIWTRVHGIVSLELTGMFDNQTVEVQRLIDLEVDNAVQLLAPPAP